MYVCVCVMYVCVHVFLYVRVCVYVFVNCVSVWIHICIFNNVYCLLHYRGNIRSFTFVVFLCTSYTVLQQYLQLCYTLYIHLIIAYFFDLDITSISLV